MVIYFLLIMLPVTYIFQNQHREANYGGDRDTTIVYLGRLAIVAVIIVKAILVAFKLLISAYLNVLSGYLICILLLFLILTFFICCTFPLLINMDDDMFD